jgi:hypothetical protein
VDAKHNLPFDYQVTNTNDAKAMGNMLKRAENILESNSFTALYDKGYHTGSEFQKADELGIEVMVAIPSVAANAPNPEYNVEKFIFDKTNDCYTCPQGEILTTNGRWHQAETYLFKRYTTTACKTCPVKPECSKAICGKAIQRCEYPELVDMNKKRITQTTELYQKRQQIVEHPYGTIKRQWGFSYILTKKGINRASSDVGFIFTAYNFRRIINIIGINELKKYLQSALFLIFGKMAPAKLFLGKISLNISLVKSWKRFLNLGLNQLYLVQNLTVKIGF